MQRLQYVIDIQSDCASKRHPYLSIYLYFNVSIKTDIQNTEGICCHQLGLKELNKLINIVDKLNNNSGKYLKAIVTITKKLTHTRQYIYRLLVPEPQQLKSFLVHIIQPSPGNITKFVCDV